MSLVLFPSMINFQATVDISRMDPPLDEFQQSSTEIEWSIKCFSTGEVTLQQEMLLHSEAGAAGAKGQIKVSVGFD